MEQGAHTSENNTGFFSALAPDCSTAKDLALTNELWDYASACYQLPEIQQLSLQLQDEFDLDVTVLLAAGWAATLGTEANWPAILPTLVRWQNEIVCPLREIRRKLNKRVAAENCIRLELLNLEINTEKTALAYLYQCFTDMDVHKKHDKFSRTLLTGLNLKNYIQWRTDLDRSDHQKLTTLTHHLSNSLSSQPTPLTDV